jgi:fused signal recognition particle receptor
MIEDKPEKPYVIVFFGINGSGKTTSIAKFAKLLMDQGKSVVLAAADTFRAASIEQLQHHGEKLGAKVIKHDYGSDPAAVAFDAVKHAKSQNTDVVLIDTAGRMHSNKNLVDEMKKIVRVSDPDLKIFVGESITGNDCVEQAKTFNEAVGIDGIILSKVDIDEKGGAAVSVGYVTKKPIVYIGVGQEYKDLKEFDSKVVVENLGLA